MTVRRHRLRSRRGEPLINAIEIVRTDIPPPPPSDGILSAASFDGTTAGPLAQVPDGGIAWKNVRGAFAVGGKLFYGMTDAKLHVASLLRRHDRDLVGRPALPRPGLDECVPPAAVRRMTVSSPACTVGCPRSAA